MQQVFSRIPMSKCGFQWSQFTGEHPCQREITFWHGCSPVYSLHWKPQFNMDILLKICCIFSEHFLIKTPIEVCFSQDFQASFTKISERLLSVKSVCEKLHLGRLTRFPIRFWEWQNNSPLTLCFDISNLNKIDDAIKPIYCLKFPKARIPVWQLTIDWNISFSSISYWEHSGDSFSQ